MTRWTDPVATSIEDELLAFDFGAIYVGLCLIALVCEAVAGVAFLVHLLGWV